MIPPLAIRSLLLVAVTAAASPAQQDRPARQDSFPGWVDALTRPLVENDITVGLVVGVLKDGADTVEARRRSRGDPSTMRSTAGCGEIGN